MSTLFSYVFVSCITAMFIVGTWIGLAWLIKIYLDCGGK